ncbi:hypothetical protein OAG29_02730 [Planctomycetaceae bacterium]|nr:hypothetical protein [Planctomycetaceae bacterium]
MTTLNQGFERLAERFRGVADRSSNEYGFDEYYNTCAAACLLFQKLKAEGTLPYLDVSLWKIALEQLGDRGEDFVKKEKMQAGCWEMEAESLCKRLPDHCGLPSNPMLWKKEPNGDGMFAKGSEIWGSKAENWAIISDWIAKSVSVLPPSHPSAHEIVNDFKQLAERFRTIAKNSDSESGPIEYNAAAASAFSLSVRLKSVGTLPYWDIRNWNIKGDTNRHMTHREKSQYECINAGHWGSFVMRILCERVPVSNGLPINPQAYQKPDENGCIGSMKTRWRPLCENSAIVCNWIAENAVVSEIEREEKSSEKMRIKKSTSANEAQQKLIAAFTRHHDYSNGSCLNDDPIGNNALAKLASVSKGSASQFFENHFSSHAKYKNVACRDVSKLVTTLKDMNGEFPLGKALYDTDVSVVDKIDDD